MERAVAIRLNEYLVANNLLPRFQSAYGRRHSTETAISRGADRGPRAPPVGIKPHAYFIVPQGLFFQNNHVNRKKFGIQGIYQPFVFKRPTFDLLKKI